MNWRATLIIISIVSPLPYVTSLSSGAPNGACSNMVPQHTGYAQESTAPFTITPNSSTVDGGSRVLVRLEAAGSGNFKGFYIQARDSSNSNEKVGTFFTATHQTQNCDGGLQNAVTHVDGNLKNAVTLEWEAPSNFEGDVMFRATVVRDYSTFWTGLQSEKVSVKKRSIDTSKPTEKDGDTPAESPSGDEASPSGIARAINDIYFGCGSIKTCIGVPENCVTRQDCTTFSSFTKVDDHIEFEIMGSGSRGGQSYAAVGLSDDSLMGDDSVMACAIDGGSVKVFNTWNQGRSNVPVIDSTAGLTVVESGLVEDKHYCRFHRRASTRFNNKNFELTSRKYHVMVASGSINSGGALMYHNTEKIVSQSPLNLAETTKINFAIPFRDIHAAIMIIAWVGAASCGILFARYFKQTWLSYKCMNLDQWFHSHRFFMVLTWALNIAGLVLIVLELQDFRLINHAFIGISSMILCFIQPFMAMCRCAPTAKNRWVFNWFHWFVGNSAQILGIAAIFFGMEIKFGSVGRNWLKEVMWYILIVFIAYHCFIHLILSILQCISDRKTKQPSDVFPLKDLSDSRIPLQGDKIREDAPLGGLRKFFLGIYLPVNWIATALLVICVIFSKGDIETTLKSWGSPEFWKDIEAQQIQ